MNDLGTLETRWSDPCDLLSAALVQALAEMPTLRKANTANTGTYSYSYADLADGMEAVRPILAAHGLAVLQPPTGIDGAPVVHTIIVHTSGQRLESALGVRPMKNDPQSVGSAISYARRYALFATLGLATEDDDGKAASTPAPPATTPTPGDARTKRMFALLGEHGIKSKADRLAYCTLTIGREIESSNDLTAAEVSRIIDSLQAMSEPNEAPLPIDPEAPF